MKKKPGHTFKKPFGARGWTLLETIITIGIIGIITASAAQFSRIQMERDRHATMLVQVAEARKQLEIFLQKKGRLPCPADISAAFDSPGFGKEAGLPGACSGAIRAFSATGGGPPGLVVAGTLPTRSMSIPDTAMLDGWGNRLLYAVTTFYTVAAPLLSTSLTVDRAAIMIQDENGINNNTGGNAIFVVISHGRNVKTAHTGSGAFVPPPGVPDPCGNNNSLANCNLYKSPPPQNAIFTNPVTPDTSGAGFAGVMEYRSGVDLFHWRQAGNWSVCTGPCGPNMGTQSQTVTCENVFNTGVPSTSCHQPPPNVQPCTAC